MAVWQPGTEVVALYNFNGNSPEDLPFKRGEILTIVSSTNDPNWFKAKKNDGRMGMLPANYVQPHETEIKLHKMPWYHGKISRGEAEQVLLNKHEDGLYLIRESANFPGDYTLCVCCSRKVEHYHILYKNNKLTVDEESYFDNLLQLVKHYEKDADGLCCKIRRPLQRSANSGPANPEAFFAASQWQIKKSDVHLVEQIGKGESGEVFKGNYRGKDVAVKVIKDRSMAPAFLDEASVMTTLRHENLVQLLGVVLDATTYIVMEFMAKGSLVDYLRTRGRAVITATDQIIFSSDTCNGMTYLEQKQIVHRDLAARNVLLNEDGTAKVADFGLALPSESNTQPGTGGKFPIKWTSPEAIKDNKFTSKSDMWSFGILLWEIYSFGRVPYPRIPLADVMAHVERGYRMEPPEGCPREVYEIMNRAWNKDPAMRPTFHEVAQILARLRSNNTNVTSL